MATELGPAALLGGMLPEATTELLWPFPNRPAGNPTAQNPLRVAPGPGLLLPAHEKAQ